MNEGMIRKKYNAMSLQVKAAFWYTVCNILQKGISLIAVPIYTRIMTAEQYGAYSVFLSWLEIFEIVATFRLSWGGYIVGLTKYEDDRDGYTSSMECLGFSITSIVFVIYLLFSDWIDQFTGMNFALTLLMFALLYAMPVISFWTARQRVEYRYIMAVIVTLTSSLLIPIIGIWAALRMPNKEYAIIGARAVVQCTIALVLLISSLRKHFVFYQKEYWNRALQFNVPLLPYYLSTVLLHSSDRIVIKSLVGQAQAGIYSVAYSAAMVMQLFNTAINASMQSWLFKRMKEERYHGIGRIINSSLMIVGGLNLLLIAFAPEAIAVLAPADYHEAIWVVPPLAASVFVMFFYQHFVNIEFYYEESKITALASIGAAVLNVFLNYRLIPVVGYLAAGYTTLFSYILFAIVHYFFMGKVCKRNHCPKDILDIHGMVRVLVLFMIIAGILTIGYGITVLRYSVIVAILAIAVWKRNDVIRLLK
ncbi:MAG: oligosaccharide flippase family protein [Roseburia sp.]|nr:oligosaccharide flippase family protein [Roseburia sp.]